jgi:pimeloyl-ACP methyl ester carboxylesterase
MRIIAGIITIIMCVVFSLPALAQTSPEAANQVKELNFVFLHGAGGNTGSMQLLSDQVIEELPAYIKEYEAANPGVKISTSFLNRNYPNGVDINTWAKNVVDSIGKYSKMNNLILIGHSFGGKAALYATAHNIGGIADKVAAVVTINSPINSFNHYYFVGGVNYWQSIWALPQNNGLLSSGVINSIAYYNSTEDGRWVGANRHWLALVSAEASPSSPQFDSSGVDPLPWNMDDMIVPISAQYSDAADVVYYGEHGHGDFTESDELAAKVADQILRYIFGKRVDVALPGKTGTFEHEAGWMPVVERWQESVGLVAAGSGTIIHQNESFFKWEQWEDVVGDSADTGNRDNYKLQQVSLPVLTGIVESRWQNSNSVDGRVYVKTRAAPRTTVKVEWSVERNPLLSRGFPRDHWEIEIISGTPFTGVNNVEWLNDDPRDQKLKIESSAEGPFRWLKAAWRTYTKAPRIRNIIGELR